MDAVRSGCRFRANDYFDCKRKVRDMDRVPPITGVAEIVLSVSDLPRMQEFYESVMGFEFHSAAPHRHGPDPDPEGDSTIVFLTIQPTESPLNRVGHPQMLVLIDYQQHVFAKRRFQGHDVTRSTLNHLAFEIPSESYQEHLTRLRSLGLEVTETVFPGMSAQAMFFRDPEGNVLEFICPQPESTGDVR